MGVDVHGNNKYSLLIFTNGPVKLRVGEEVTVHMVLLGHRCCSEGDTIAMLPWNRPIMPGCVGHVHLSFPVDAVLRFASHAQSPCTATALHTNATALKHTESPAVPIERTPVHVHKHTMM